MDQTLTLGVRLQHLGIQGQSSGVCFEGALSLMRRYHRESGEGGRSEKVKKRDKLSKVWV